MCPYESNEKEAFFCMAKNDIIILSDDKSNSGRREIPSKPVISSNKAYIFPAEHKCDNEETPSKNLTRDPSHRKKIPRKNQAITYQVWILGY